MHTLDEIQQIIVQARLVRSRGDVSVAEHFSGNWIIFAAEEIRYHMAKDDHTCNYNDKKYNASADNTVYALGMIGQ